MEKKKKIFIIFIIIILLLIATFCILKIREYIDSHTEFTLNNDRFILDYVGIPVEGGLANGNHYYEIDLEKKIMDYRYDFEYFDIPINSWFKKTFGNKKRKLEKRYRINDDIVKELRDLFSEFTQMNNNNEISQTLTGNPFDYYLLKSNKGDYNIKDENQISRIKQIINKIRINDKN